MPGPAAAWAATTSSQSAAPKAAISRGPLTYSLKIGERWEKYGGTDKWPAFEVFPTTPWNYGLIVDLKDPAASFKEIKAKEAVPPQPFTVNNAPIQLVGKGKKITQWKMEAGLVGSLQDSPARSDEPVEEITLIPMGCARLRIAAFPVASTSPAPIISP